MSEKIKEAMNTLKQAMKKDYGYAWSWHCNIAMMCYDAGADHKIANDGAARFMKLCFDVDTSHEPIINTEQAGARDCSHKALATPDP